MAVVEKTPVSASLPDAFQEPLLAALAEACGDPDWLKTWRREALDRARSLAAPSRQEETWRRTDPARFRLDRLSPSAPRPQMAAAQVDALLRDYGGLPEIREGLLVTVDGAPQRHELGPMLRSKGAHFTDFGTAAREHADPLRAQLFGGEAPASLDRWSALNAAFVSGGAYVRIPRGQSLELPVCIFHHLETPDRALFLNTVLHLEEGSSATVVEIFHGREEAGGLTHAAINVVAESGSRLRYLRLQELGSRTLCLSRERLLAQRDTTVEWSWGTLGASMCKSDMQAHLAGEGAHAVLSGFYHGSGNQHLDHHTFQNHQSGHTTSDLLYKGALTGRARSVYMGLIKIHKDAQRSDAYQANRNLMLSPAARADSIPSLEIEANDVRCTHGATMGQLDEEQLFYLRSRGLPREEASRLIVEGFYEPVLDRLGDQAVRAMARARLHRRLLA